MILYVLSLKRKAGVFIDLKFVVGCCWSWGFGAAKMGEEKKGTNFGVVDHCVFALPLDWILCKREDSR